MRCFVFSVISHHRAGPVGPVLTVTKVFSAGDSCHLPPSLPLPCMRPYKLLRRRSDNSLLSAPSVHLLSFIPVGRHALEIPKQE